MYAHFSLIIKRGDEQVAIDYLIGVYQGENLAPLLFVLVFQAATETLETIEQRKRSSTPTYRFFFDTIKGTPIIRQKYAVKRYRDILLGVTLRR